MFDSYEYGFEEGYTKGLEDRSIGKKHKIKVKPPKGGDEKRWKEGYVDGYNKAYPKVKQTA